MKTDNLDLIKALKLEGVAISDEFTIKLQSKFKGYFINSLHVKLENYDMENMIKSIDYLKIVYKNFDNFIMCKENDKNYHYLFLTKTNFNNLLQSDDTFTIKLISGGDVSIKDISYHSIENFANMVVSSIGEFTFKQDVELYKKKSNYDFFTEEFLTDVTVEKLHDLLLKYSLNDFEYIKLYKFLAEEFKKVGTKTTVTEMKNYCREYLDNFKPEEMESIDILVARFFINNYYNAGKYIINYTRQNYIYKDGYFQEIDEQVLKKQIMLMIESICKNSKIDEYEKSIKNKILESKSYKMLNSFTDHVYECVLKLSSKDKSDDVFNYLNKRQLPYLIINCKTNTLRIHDNGTVEVKPHNYEDYLTSKLEIEYNPKETGHYHYEIFSACFNSLPDKHETTRSMLEFLSYSLFDNQKLEALIGMLYGNGNNGKSFVMNRFRKAIGSQYIVSSQVQRYTNGNTHATVDLINKKMLYDNDCNFEKPIDSGFLKSISEKTPITVEPKYRDSFNIVAMVTPLVSSNGFLKTSDTTKGFSRRLFCIPYLSNFEKDTAKHKVIESNLDNELSGFLNLLIESIICYKKRGSVFMSNSVKQYTDKWTRLSNAFHQFMHDKITVTNNENDYIHLDKLHSYYENYINNELKTKMPTSTSTFESSLVNSKYELRIGVSPLNASKKIVIGIKINE